ncbi:MAG: GNAT family N-acetyltransferase [Inhella sp.]|jgi:GNAT superfamily N-acetyltransferase|uniref:GNAT family N-acetyltransferase n=1 Tax=Inhella sp. TaxID=1921806 RepID=UPI0022CB041A|nr:GNAT family N-acetyltransferase [Inhella sp.]MCZ8235297.1 GNAT family N-acetyltransferase [Inhella sp.]
MNCIRALARPTPDELEQLARTLVACVAAGASIGWVQAPSQEAARRFWQGVAEGVARGERHWWGAEHAGELVGTVSLIVAQPENGTHRADIAKLMVAPHARRLGLANALMDAAETQAQRLGKRLLVLDTHTDSPAERLYARRGWQRCGVMPDYAQQADGSLGATSWMVRRWP